MVSGLYFMFKNRLHTLPEDQNTERNSAAIKAIPLFIMAFLICIALFHFMDMQDGEYQPYMHDFCFQIEFMILGIFCPLHYCKDRPNFVIFIKNQIFFPPTILPWAYSNESMELISHSQHLSDQFYLDLLSSEKSLNNREIILKELYRIRKTNKSK